MQSNILNLIKQYSHELYDKTIEYRRYIHQNPELSFQEFETQKYVKQKLIAIGINDIQEKANTGILAKIKGEKKNGKGKVIALRADMDALPIIEMNDIPYKSKKKGIMHACGHDVHTASLLSTAEILYRLKSEFSGEIKLLFQPGEEKFPGGASLMIKDGVLKNPIPHSVIGQHVMPLLPAGKVGFRKGLYMASADEVYITVKGVGGHAALPDTLIDPILISAHILTALQQVISRWSKPKSPAVLSFGKVTANGATNVIPDTVEIEGTFRAMNEDFRCDVHKRLPTLVNHIAEGMGGTAYVKINKGYPCLINDDLLTQKLKDSAISYLGYENVVDLDIWMAAEDFSYYSQKLPSSFYRLGTRNEEKGIINSVHQANFNIDEKALKIGPGLMAWLSLQEMEN